MLHYKSKRHPSYPTAACGKNLISMEFTDDIEKVKCETCKKSLDRKEESVIKSKGPYGIGG